MTNDRQEIIERVVKILEAVALTGQLELKRFPTPQEFSVELADFVIQQRAEAVAEVCEPLKNLQRINYDAYIDVVEKGIETALSVAEKYTKQQGE